jgi:hypothetical protein
LKHEMRTAMMVKELDPAKQWMSTDRWSANGLESHDPSPEG